MNFTESQAHCLRAMGITPWSLRINPETVPETAPNLTVKPNQPVTPSLPACQLYYWLDQQETPVAALIALASTQPAEQALLKSIAGSLRRKTQYTKSADQLITNNLPLNLPVLVLGDELALVLKKYHPELAITSGPSLAELLQDSSLKAPLWKNIQALAEQLPC